MAFQPLSVGDILMLSQTAWKIGRAFTQGKKSAPSEFAEVERESNGLSEALKLVAETLHENSSIMSQAEPQTRAAVSTILESASKTLSDLESFVERYQVIRKHEMKGGFVVERRWTDAVLANYKTFKWTTEGGDITELRNMLQMHTSTINLTMQALQSRSLSRLERTVVPMAKHVADVHRRVHGESTDKISDLHRIMMAVVNSSPALQARDWDFRNADVMQYSSSSASLTRHAHSSPRQIEASAPRSLSQTSASVRQVDRPGSEQSNLSAKERQASREDSAYYSIHSIEPLRIGKGARPMDWNFESGFPPPDSSYDFDASSASGSSSGYGDQSRRDSSIARRESMTLPNLFSAIDEVEAEVVAGAHAFDTAHRPDGGENHDGAEDDGNHDDGYFTGTSPSVKTSPVPTRSLSGSHKSSELPPPALPPSPLTGRMSPATPTTFFARPKSSGQVPNGVKEPVAYSDTFQSSTGPGSAPPRTRSMRTAKEPYSPDGNGPDSPSFEKLLFRNSAILCDVRGALVEYAVAVPGEPDPRFNTEMKAACKAARICVIRKRENRDFSGSRVVTSIWTLSDDGATKMQLRLSGTDETVPFASYFDPCKISIPPTGSDLSLHFHPDTYGDELREEKTTNWVNYVFQADADAVAFQSAIFGRNLIGSYRTTKTTVIHEGFKGAFAFEEQFANIEMCRLFEDDGVATPGGAGGVLILMHISSNFGEGWARFWINSSRQRVRIKEDGSKYAKVKGIDILVVKPGGETSIPGKVTAEVEAQLQRMDTADLMKVRPMGGRRIPIRKVKGVRMEFKTEEERDRFVRACRKAQERMIALPDL